MGPFKEFQDEIVVSKVGKWTQVTQLIEAAERRQHLRERRRKETELMDAEELVEFVIWFFVLFGLWLAISWVKAFWAWLK